MNRKQEQVRTPAAAALHQLVLEVFRFNGIILNTGDGLAGEFGLTSSLWQVLGSIDPRPLTMAQIGRVRGLTRQSVRRSVGVLRDKEFVELRENPDHKRAKLVALTPAGRRALEEVNRREIVFSNLVTQEFDERQLAEMARSLRAMGDKFETPEDKPCP